MKSQQLWFTEPYTIEIREQALQSLQADQVLVGSLYSAISAGTEMLVYKGQIPNTMTLDMNLQALKNQQTSYPLQYGYATVGRINEIGQNIDASMIGKLVFAHQPHASHFITEADQLVFLPEGIDPIAAVFLANMETAINLILDGSPRIGENVVVLGQGIVGLLVSGVLAMSPLAGVYALDRIEKRRTWGKELGVDKTFDPDNPQDLEQLNQSLHPAGSAGGADLVYELSGVPEALNLAIELCGFDSRIVVGSWYGTKSAKLNLGGKFHRDRIQIISSQVSTISPALTGRWNRSRRFNTAWDMTRALKPEQLITHHIPFSSAAEAYRLLNESAGDVMQAVLVYEN